MLKQLMLLENETYAAAREKADADTDAADAAAAAVKAAVKATWYTRS